MLPSKGYFSGIPCIYYSVGECSRPHCHYRHSAQDITDDSDNKRDEPIRTEVRTSYNLPSNAHVNLEKLVEKAVDKVLRDDSHIDENLLGRDSLSTIFSDSEPVKRTQSKRTSEIIPSYQPTPIAQLKSRHIPVTCVLDKPFSVIDKCEETSTKIRPDIPYGHNSNDRSVYGNRNIQFPSDDLTYNLAESQEVDTKDDSSKEDSNESNYGLEETYTQSKQEIGNAIDKIDEFKGKTERIESQTDRKTDSKRKKSRDDHKSSSRIKTEAPRAKKSDTTESTIKSKEDVRKSSSKRARTEDSDKSRSKRPKESKNNDAPPIVKTHDKGKRKHTDSDNNKNGSSSGKQKTNTPQVTRSKLPTPIEMKSTKTTKSVQPLGTFNDKPPNKEIKSQTPLPVTKFQAISDADPFTRWSKNKRLREILGKKDNVKIVKTESSCVKKYKPIEKEISMSVQPTEPSSSEPVTEVLPVAKLTPRVAHKKCESRPLPISFGGNKIAPGFRQHFCDSFYDEFKKTMTVEDARLRAMEEELEVAKNSGAKSYKNNCSLLLMKLRKHGCVSMDVDTKTAIELGPSSTPDYTYGWSMYKCFSKYLLSEDELRENGYPLAHPDQDDCAYIDKNFRRYTVEQPDKPFVRVCSNCSEEFTIDEDGLPITKNDCFYHWGRLRKVRAMGQWMEKFTCCDGAGDAAPCESSSYHVWSGRDEDCLPDFIHSPELPSNLEESDAGVYGLDCEMCYTTKGLELARLTVIDLNEKIVFDEVVSLENPVLDFCTRFSGIDENKIRRATHTFDDVRRWMMDHFFDKTILVGHSLENDLKALKLIHENVVDTSVTFPHKYGPPSKMSLKHLASSVLNISIQENEGGHDSKEDAATCLKLMLMKIKEDSKVRKPRIVIGYSGKKQ